MCGGILGCPNCMSQLQGARDARCSANLGQPCTVKRCPTSCPTWEQLTGVSCMAIPIYNELNIDPNSVSHDNKMCSALKTAWPWEL